MGLFDGQLEEIRAFADEARAQGRLRELDLAEAGGWPLAASLVLEEDTALEIGNPRLASLTMLLWGEPGTVCGGRVSIIGPDLTEARDTSLPFAQVVLVSGEFPDEYDSYRDVRDALYDTRLEGLSVRTMPSRQTLWCRISRDAAERGLSLAHLGREFVEALEEVPGVEAAEVLFVTSSPEDVSRLSGAAASVQRVVEAMMKMYQEENFDCETCEYADVCDTVMDLKKIRDKLAGER